MIQRWRYRNRLFAIALISLTFLSTITICVSTTNDDDGNDDGIIIAQTCATTTRHHKKQKNSRRSIYVERLTFSCSENEDESNDDDDDDSSSSTADCNVGDFASVTVDFSWKKKVSSGSTLQIKISSFYDGTMETVLEPTSLCAVHHELMEVPRYSFRSSSGVEDSCNLRLGTYRAYLNFTIPNFGINDDDERSSSFTPSLRLLFLEDSSSSSSSSNFVVRRLGCVETGILAERALRWQRETKAAHVFMICTVLFGIIFVILLYWCKQNKKEQMSELDKANDRILQRRFHYQRTTRNGGVVVAAIGGGAIGIATTIDDEDHESMMMNMSTASEWSRRQFT